MISSPPFEANSPVIVLSKELLTAMLDAQDRRWAGYPRRGSLYQEALELLWWGDIGGWIPKR